MVESKLSQASNQTLLNLKVEGIQKPDTKYTVHKKFIGYFVAH